MQMTCRTQSMPLPQCQPEMPRNRVLADLTSSMPLPESSSMPSLIDSNGVPNEDPFASEFGPGFGFLAGVSFDPSSSQHSEISGDSGKTSQRSCHSETVMHNCVQQVGSTGGFDGKASGS